MQRYIMFRMLARRISVARQMLRPRPVDVHRNGETGGNAARIPPIRCPQVLE